MREVAVMHRACAHQVHMAGRCLNLSGGRARGAEVGGVSAGRLLLMHISAEHREERGEQRHVLVWLGWFFLCILVLGKVK